VKPEATDLASQAREIVAEWKARGCEFVSIIDGVLTPWDPKPIGFIGPEAERSGLDVLSLSSPLDLALILAMIERDIERDQSIVSGDGKSSK